MRFLTIMDPPASLNPTTDTTVAILEEALQRGHEVAVCQPRDLWLHGDEAVADVQRVVSVSRARRPAVTVEFEVASHALSHFHAVLMRKDPPYDQAYHLCTLLMERARGRTVLINDPRGLRDANEKLYIFNFPELIAPTIVTSSIARLRAFLHDNGGQIMIKPLDGYGGLGIFYVHRDDRNANAIFEMSTLDGAKWVMAQRYIPEARQGDKRVLLLDGDPIGAVLRVPAADDSRGNLHVGGRAELTELTERDRVICARLKPRLLADGLRLVGIDIIGGYLTEVNVTSPTGVQQIDALLGIRLEARIVDWIEGVSISPK